MATVAPAPVSAAPASAAPASAAPASAAALKVVSQGKSDYSIVVPRLAAVSVQDAAAEMQRSITEATGARLPLRKDDETFTGPYISLGATTQARTAGLSAEKIGYDGFRIVTKGENLYILGVDTTAAPSGWKNNVPTTMALHPEVPGPAYTRSGGFSNGTANGVFTFLEQHLGVRWLFPGDLGRDVPVRQSFALAPLDRTTVPDFNFRILSTIRGADDWRARQKLGFSFRIQYVHNFEETVSADLYKTHPEWFPMIGGVRPQPPALRYKLETTNPELVRYFADRAIAALKANPQMNSYSLTPSDSRGWSESPESKALYDPAPSGAGAPSVTPLVLKFYRDVAALVAKELPHAYVDGLLYQDFSYPPTKGSMELPKNFIPMIVGKSMGYNFYVPEVLELEKELLNSWSKVAPENWYYYGMPTWLRESSGMVTPAAARQLTALYSSMHRAHIKGAEIYGTLVWSQGALVNYVNAKMLWEPTADATLVQRDWLMRAYGPAAGAVMERLYNKLDESWWSDYFRSPQSQHYNVSDALFRDTFGAHYPEMEKLFLEADAQPMTAVQKQRLALIRNNMIVLQFRLRNAGYLPADYTSALTRTSQQVFALFTDEDTKDQFSYIIVGKDGAAVSPVPVRLAKAEPAAPTPAGATPAGAAKPTRLPNNKHVLLYPTKDGEVRLRPTAVSPGASFLVYYVQDENGKGVRRGFLAQGQEITFPVVAHKPYYFMTSSAGVTHRPQISWTMKVPGAVPATASFENDVLSLRSSGPVRGGAEAAPLYVFVPEGMGLQSETDDSGVVFQTETDATVNLRLAAEARKKIQEVLDAARVKYRATLVQSLDREWKFTTDPQKVGERDGFMTPGFDDSAWRTIDATGYWHSQGFSKYHGTAWYRKTITVSGDETDPLATGSKGLLLFFGAVDGDAEFYLNGQKIGKHVMADHAAGWEVPVVLDVTPTLHTGKNTLAVKVTKDTHVGGIYRGVSLLSGVLPRP